MSKKSGTGRNPQGVRYRSSGYVGQAYSNPAINFTLMDGIPDFALGDVFRIVVPPGSGKVKALDFGAIDGSADAYGVMISGVGMDGMDNMDIMDGMDRKGVAIVRDAQIVADCLVWPADATENQKAAGMMRLRMNYKG